MNIKSLSPRAKYPSNTSQNTLKKISSLQENNPSNQKNASTLRLNFPESHSSIINSNRNSESARIALKLSSPRSQQLNYSRKYKLRSVVQKYSNNKSSKTLPKNIGEHLLPLSSEQTITIFEDILSVYELTELLEYTYIYYLGLKAQKIMPITSNHNLGYDDKETDYIINIGDHIAYKYEILEILGSGSFSKVCKC